MGRIFSGIQPSGELHLGNYLGAVKNWVKMQHEHECFICIVDYHAITQPYEINRLKEHTQQMAVGLLAAGIDPAQTVLFVQSHVAEHTELAWVFTSVTPIGELERMTQFKDKSRRQESVLAGILNYPVLQAADVLLYKAELVPVGEDQTQHIELMREIARKWNTRYAENFFPEPQVALTTAARIVGLDGDAKMSKSLGNTIGMLDDPDEIWERLRPAVTDPARIKKTDPGTPERCNIYSLHGHFSADDEVQHAAAQCRVAGWGCIECKRLLSDNIARAFSPMRNRASELQADSERVRNILRDGAARASVVARDTMAGVRSAMGFAPAGAGVNPGQ
jgi:tryptophanyl-tRNA synthetase